MNDTYLKDYTSNKLFNNPLHMSSVTTHHVYGNYPINVEKPLHGVIYSYDNRQNIVSSKIYKFEDYFIKISENGIPLVTNVKTKNTMKIIKRFQL